MHTLSIHPDMLWNSWQDPTAAEQLAFAQAVVPHVKWLHCDIVAGIARDNSEPYWDDFLTRVPEIKRQQYLWANSPCVFPGIRRSTGNRSDTPGSIVSKDCLRTDPTNNFYPNQLWQRVMQGPSTKSRKQIIQCEKPKNFHLAHLIYHKDFNAAERRLLKDKANEETVEGVRWLSGPEQPAEQNAFAGLFTSAANLCFLPAELMKPTDISGALLHLLLQQAVARYRDVCTLFPYGLEFKAPNPLKWQYDAQEGGKPMFKWDAKQYGDPALTAYLNQWRRVELEEVLRIKRTPSEKKKTPFIKAFYAPS